ncbi:MAG: hypothetical protein AWU58_41 [Methanohalophilus sp. T328-1]|uniref:DUF5320 domain-containing protein n=1 Tax=Methanohalophilus euhalobius TaxID=51203 RepID=A0A285EZF0_9EURY|nr:MULTISPECIES: DUF5320 domain-containing protein [Methanohalophilus]KXS47070.1 MAG: hypothetical protein AWU58_41 [Methanohalophilus sp. T328-1]RSD34528.1 MAG: hypothetical protein CI953_792 [Methanohalophilus sp.]ODV50575.1 MAG: hypothetical protein A8273_116 [Methanohalophilus sp. 2-GBenrich]RSD35991.1 MAG: hypothetical protein CI952_578 [Methanohalophilus sp.]TCL12706.1 hypothetical protein C7960_1976 [Methanohalophilus euhalobius]
MPGGDRTGPRGMGPMTGKGAGYCTGYDIPGWQNRLVRGNSFRGGFYRFGGPFKRGMGYYRGGPIATPPQPVSPQSELEALEREKDLLSQRIEQLKTQLSGKGSEDV